MALSATILLSALGLSLFHKERDSTTYELAHYETIVEFSDSTVDAIFKDGTNSRLDRTSSLDSVFEEVLLAQSKATVPLDFIARDVIRRPTDDVSVRFGSTISCDRALIYADNTALCDHELYFKLVDAMDASSSEH